MTGQTAMKYMDEAEARRLMVDIGRRMYLKGFVAANDGNLSVKVGPDALLVTPTGVSKGYMDEGMMVKVDLEGRVLSGGRPTSELAMHLRVYRENPEVTAVVHAHPPVATSFAIAGIPLDRPILTEAILNLGAVPVAPYATPGTAEVPESIAPFCRTHNAVLLANHGAVTWGRDLLQAYYRMESVEYYATILMYTGNIIGRSNELSCTQVSELVRIRERMGTRSGGVPEGTPDNES